MIPLSVFRMDVRRVEHNISAIPRVHDVMICHNAIPAPWLRSIHEIMMSRSPRLLVL
jgi:hypothetical protein